MKNRLFRLLALLVALVVVLGIGLTMAIGTMIRKAVTTLGPQWTQTDVQLSEVTLSPFTGNGEVLGFLLGNPKGYQAPAAVRMARAKLALSPTSLFRDKILIQSIVVESPEITIEGGFKKNNLSKIIDNIRSAGRRRDSTATEPDRKRPSGGPRSREERKLQVDEFIIEGATLHYAVPGLGGEGFSFALPRIELRDLGMGTNGITTDELLIRVLDELTKGSKPRAVNSNATSRVPSAGVVRRGTAG